MLYCCRISSNKSLRKRWVICRNEMMAVNYKNENTDFDQASK